MLSGERLGKAIDTAIRLKGVSKAAVARHFGVKPPSVQDWIRRGTIDKSRLPELWGYFADVVGPSHWGLSKAHPAGPASHFEALTQDEVNLLNDLRALIDEDREDIRALVAQKARKARAYMEALSREKGLKLVASPLERKAEHTSTIAPADPDL